MDIRNGRATAVGGRFGNVASDDAALRAVLAPVEGAAGQSRGTNAEQLVAAGLAAAFLDSLCDVATEQGAEIGPESNVTGHVSIANDGEGVAQLSLSLSVDLPDLDRARAAEIVAVALRTCPYARAMAGALLTCDVP